MTKINLPELQCNRTGTANFGNLIMTSTVLYIPVYNHMHFDTTKIFVTDLSLSFNL